MDFIQNYGYWVAAFIIIWAFSRRNKKRKAEAKQAAAKRLQGHADMVQSNEEK